MKQTWSSLSVLYILPQMGHITVLIPLPLLFTAGSLHWQRIPTIFFVIISNMLVPTDISVHQLMGGFIGYDCGRQTDRLRTLYSLPHHQIEAW
ncbi:hypothetical protein C7452_0021 [Methanothermobacter defluvii]|uniref:Uncharacterized protein n=1 Tax=Methanothermobacter defluvii TaxID=49339 RepID=A0A371NC01_9EURY|nr:hypothetical protein C7452_0021 [Methanothermobacter defluvii]